MANYTKPDHWARKARDEGYAARSVFKLDEVHKRFPILPRSASGGAPLHGAASRAAPVAVDLGCFPGSWSMWLLERGVRVIGVDLKAPELAGGTWIVMSALEVTAEQLLEAAGGPVDLLVSDMAPNTTGQKFTDHVRQIELATRALELAKAVLTPGGAFVAKVFDGADAPAYVRAVQASFGEFKRLKPEATRDSSIEFFVAGRGVKPGTVG